MSLGPLQFVSNQRARRALLFALAVLAIWPLLAWIAARKLIATAELTHADAIVVLAGSSAYVERAHRAAQLFREGRAGKIVLTNDNQESGWSNELQRNPLFIERAAAELVDAGVSQSAIELLSHPVSSTHDEALLLRDYAVAHDLRSILIVTSAYHSRRALWIFRRAFAGSSINVGIATVAPGWQTPAPSTWWLRPSGWETVAGEYLKFLYDWCFYY